MGAHLRARDSPLHRGLGGRLPPHDHALGDLERAGELGRPREEPDVARLLRGILPSLRGCKQAPQGLFPAPRDRRIRQLRRDVDQCVESRTRTPPCRMLPRLSEVRARTWLPAGFLLLAQLLGRGRHAGTGALRPRRAGQGGLRGRADVPRRVAAGAVARKARHGEAGGGDRRGADRLPERAGRFGGHLRRPMRPRRLLAPLQPAHLQAP